LLRGYFDEGEKWKALRIARTECGAAASQGQMEAARQSGYVTKKVWVSAKDDRVRDSHEAIDGEAIALEDTFSNGCTAPGIGDDPAETINCRCAIGFSV
jgi:SPP1 gp7 family putative phage head morphogenesis protein